MPPRGYRKIMGKWVNTNAMFVYEDQCPEYLKPILSVIRKLRLPYFIKVNPDMFGSISDYKRYEIRTSLLRNLPKYEISIKVLRNLSDSDKDKLEILIDKPWDEETISDMLRTITIQLK